jgi:CHAT domain-containing protein/tetratricopeptide (TPR) repeat protein
MNARHLNTSTARFTLSAALVLLLSASRVSGQAAAAPLGCKLLPAGADAEHNIGAGEKHCFTFDLLPGEFFQARVEPKGVNLLLRLLDAGGKELAQANSPNDKEGREVVTYVASAAGGYVLEVGLLDAEGGSGAYVIRREAARPATPQDGRRMEVERLWAEGIAARRARARIALAVEKLSAAESGWRELGDADMAEIAARRVKQARAVALFRDGQTIFKISQQTPESLRAAEEKLRESHRMFGEAGDKHGEGGALTGLATITYFKGEKRAALELYKQALSLYLVTRSRMEEAGVRSAMASVYLELRDMKYALEQMLLALPILRELENHELSVADTENDIGTTYFVLGEYKPALEHLEQALAVKRKLNDACSIAVSLTNTAVVYSAMGEKARALNLLTEQTLPLYPADGKCSDKQALTQSNIGKIYYDLGEYALALKYHRDALRLQLASSNNPNVASSNKQKSDEAAIRANIGVTHYGTRDYAKALSSFDEALTLYRNVHDREREAILLTNVGVVETAQGKYARALETFRKALWLRREVGDRNGEAITLNNIGETYSASGEGPKALEYFKQSLPLFRAAGDRSGEAVALGNAMSVSRRFGNRRMAIFYGKQSVNNFQELRGAARVRDHEIQRNYLRIIRGAYEELMETLMEEGLYEQAVKVLNLYQDQQFFDFDRAASSVGRVDFTEREQSWIDRYRHAGEAVGKAGARVVDLREQRAGRQPSQEESAQLSKLQEEFEKAIGASLAVFKEAEAEFALPPDAKDQPGSVTDVSDMRGALNALDKRPQQKTVALYTLTGADRFYVLLVTPQGVEAFSSPFKAAAVNARVGRLYELLKQPGFPVRQASTALYDVIFKATSTRRAGVTLEAELERSRPDLLLWSLNGTLNYISVAALYDAGRRQYLVERYQNAVFTRADGKRLLRESRDWTSGIGFGKAGASRFLCEDEERPRGGASPPLGALDFVPRELSTIFVGGRGRPPLVPGRVLLDDDFKLGAMVESLKGKDIPLVHISSHFCLRSGDAENSFLLLGDDTKFTLFEMKEHRGLFEGVDLLVLSACRTAALRSNSKTGRELDSLAELSQRLGASSVIATKWDTTDAGAGRLMIEFYQLRKEFPQLSKAELLRRAQLKLLRGETKQRGLTHPSYWSAFVLYGSFR